MASTIGQKLKEARMAQGRSLEDVSHETKIPVAALEAMERDDFSVFGSATYSRSFVKLYSRHLGVDVGAEAQGPVPRWSKGRKKGGDFLETSLLLKPVGATIPIVKHRVIERKVRRSPLGAVAVLGMMLLLPAIYYVGKRDGVREGLRFGQREATSAGMARATEKGAAAEGVAEVAGEVEMAVTAEGEGVVPRVVSPVRSGEAGEESLVRREAVFGPEEGVSVESLPPLRARVILPEGGIPGSAAAQGEAAPSEARSSLSRLGDVPIDPDNM